MSRETDMSRLTTELTDFLDLPEALGLPRVQSVECKRTAHTPWQVRAYLTAPTDDARYRAISEWAAFAGGTVEISAPYQAPHMRSGMQRTLTARIVIAKVPIELNAAVDGRRDGGIVKTFLRTALEIAHKSVMFATPCAVAMIFIACSAASVTGAHVQAAVIT